jgi:hypothetical protein
VIDLRDVLVEIGKLFHRRLRASSGAHFTEPKAASLTSKTGTPRAIVPDG